MSAGSDRGLPGSRTAGQIVRAEEAEQEQENGKSTGKWEPGDRRLYASPPTQASQAAGWRRKGPSPAHRPQTSDAAGTTRLTLPMSGISQSGRPVLSTEVAQVWGGSQAQVLGFRTAISGQGRRIRLILLARLSPQTRRHCPGTALSVSPLACLPPPRAASCDPARCKMPDAQMPRWTLDPARPLPHGRYAVRKPFSCGPLMPCLPAARTRETQDIWTGHQENRTR